MVELVTFHSAGSHLGGLDDDQLLRELGRLGFDGLVTCDYHMLSNSEVLRAMKDTGLTVVACKDVGHDTVRASGLLLFNLQNIANNFDYSQPQPWILSSRQSQPSAFRNHIRKLENRHGGSIGV